MNKKREPGKDQWEKLFDLARNYAQAKPWELFSDMDLFALSRPSTQELVFPLIMGCGGEFFGLSFYRGETGLVHYSLAQSEMEPDNPLFLAMYSNLLLSFMEREYLEKHDIVLPGISEVRIKRRKMWPQYRKMGCMRVNSGITKEEADLFIEMIPLVLEVVDLARSNSKLLEVFDEKPIPLLLKNEAGHWVSANLQNIPGAMDFLEPPKLMGNRDADMLGSLEIREDKWQLGWKVAPAFLGNDPQDMASMAVMHIVDKETGVPRQFRTISPDRPEDLWIDFWRELVSMVKEEKFLPSVIEVSDPWVAEAIKPLGDLGIRIVEREFLPELEAVFDFVFSQMPRGGQE